MLLILTHTIYFLGLLLIGVAICAFLPFFIFLNTCNDSRDKRGKLNTETYMIKRQKNMQKILQEDFRDECILKTESGESYSV